MRQIGALCERVAFYKPRAIRHLMLTNAESHLPAEVDVTHWRGVVFSLFLSETQVCFAFGGTGGKGVPGAQESVRREGFTDV